MFMLNKKDAEEILKHNGFVKMIGMELLDVQEGFASGRIRLEEKHTNVYAGMHGGCTYALADTLAGIAASTYGNFVTTIDGKMNYLFPIKDTEYVYCEAKAVRQGGRIGLYETKIMDDKKQVLATAEFTYYRTSKKITDSKE